ncbi:uncharacterized protein LOC104913764 [Meleagris gallopavo]|uniref:uncharacterized protein LOC104913764 n=1 Tax=Meleagris gallopavo TaxID=9103 RepID=UPI0012ABBCD7|nr:uncharacterized protein LOC104913764 [Meleagris gallopavo]
MDGVCNVIASSATNPEASRLIYLPGKVFPDLFKKAGDGEAAGLEGAPSAWNQNSVAESPGGEETCSSEPAVRAESLHDLPFPHRGKIGLAAIVFEHSSAAWSQGRLSFSCCSASEGTQRAEKGQHRDSRSKGYPIPKGIMLSLQILECSPRAGRGRLQFGFCSLTTSQLLSRDGSSSSAGARIQEPHCSARATQDVPRLAKILFGNRSILLSSP